jgi:hypothetical protein
MHHRTRQASRAVGGHRLSRRLLKPLVGEQPVRRIGELRRSPAPQQRRLHQYRGPITETLTRGSDIGDQSGGRQRQVGDIAQRLPSDVALQIRNVIEPEIYDGLTPVTITL